MRFAELSEAGSSLDASNAIAASFTGCRSKPIPDDQWETLDAFWQLRRAEILADIQVMKEFASNPPMPEHILQSQTTLGSEKHREMKLLHSLTIAGYDSADAINSLVRTDPVEFSWIAFLSRQQMVIHDRYEEYLATADSAQASEGAQARVEAAQRALAEGEASIRSYLDVQASR